MIELRCKHCGERHCFGVEALRCDEKIADKCGCGKCPACTHANWWRNHPSYVEERIIS